MRTHTLVLILLDEYLRALSEVFLCVSFRGNSKYHYYGLRIKSGSPLLRLMDEQQHMAMRQQPFSQKNRYLHMANAF